MEPGETPYREERSHLPVALLAGAVIVLADVNEAFRAMEAGEVIRSVITTF